MHTDDRNRGIQKAVKKCTKAAWKYNLGCIWGLMYGYLVLAMLVIMYQ